MSAPVTSSRQRAGKEGAALVALLGSMAAATLFVADVERWEGKERRGYIDIAGIPTKCSGDTTDVAVGKLYSDADCRASTERQAVVHLAAVRRCTPTIAGHQLHAAGLLAYNIGPAAYCRSTVARRFNAGAIANACDGFLAWNKARVRGRLTVVRGLANRRAYERAICRRAL